MNWIGLIIIFSQPLWASSQEPRSVQLELGEDYALPASSRIWIENKDVLRAEILGNTVIIKTIHTGSSYVRTEKELLQISVSPIGTYSSAKKWKNLKKKFNGLEVKSCGNVICAFGGLNQLLPYLNILKLAEHEQAPLLMALKPSVQVQSEIKKYVAAQLRDHGFTPQKIIFSDVWRSYYPQKSLTAALKLQLRKLGIEAIGIENANQLADNVKVSVQIVEMNKSFSQKLGLSWPDQYKAQIINLQKVQTTPIFDLALNAAESSGQAKILASPKLVCRSGKEAEFFAGGEFPVKVSNTRTSHIEWKRFGIGLKLRPQVDPLGQLNLQIETEISSVDLSLKVDDMPAVQMNRVSSFFDLINQKTISLSGLIKNETSHNAEGLPFLQSLPIIGNLFKSKNFVENKSELVIFVTPELLNPENELEP